MSANPTRLLSLGILIARGGSRRVPGKNIRLLNGVPLIAFMARAAAASALDRLILSTDDAAIAGIAAANGVDVPFRRSAELAEDVPSEFVILDALERTEQADGKHYDIVVTLQPTTPFVLPADIEACIDALRTSKANCAFTAAPVREPPEWMFVTDNDGNALPFLDGSLSGSRGVFQSLARKLIPNGAVYATRTDQLRDQRTIFCPPIRIIEMTAERSVDIDEPIDWIVAEAVARQHGFEPVPLPPNGRPAGNVFATAEPA